MKQVFNKKNLFITSIVVMIIAIIGITAFTNASTANPYVIEVIDEGKNAIAKNNQLEMTQKIITEESDDTNLVYELSLKNVIERKPNVEVALVIDNSYSMQENTEPQAMIEKAQSLANDMIEKIPGVKVSISDNSGIKLGLNNNAENTKNVISSVQWGNGNTLETGVTYGNSSFSNSANTQETMVIITDSTDNIRDNLISMTNNDVQIIFVVCNITNNVIGTPEDSHYGPIYMLDTCDNDMLIDEISKSIININTNNILTPEILKTFDITILENSENVKNITTTDTGFSYNVDCIKNNETATIKYKLSLKSEVEIDRNIIYKTWYSSKEVTANYKIDGIARKLTIEQEKTPTFTVCETYDLKIKAVNAKNTSLEVAGIEFKVEGKDSKDNIVYSNTLTTDRYGYVTVEKIKTLDKVTYSIKPIVNIVGYEETESRNIIIDNDYLGRRVLEVTTDGLKYDVDDIERIVEVEFPIETQGFDFEINLTELNNNNVKLSNTEFRLIQPKLNNRYEMEALYGTTNENGQVFFHPAVMTKAGTYDYILSQMDEVSGYESMGNVTLRLTFNDEGKITKAVTKYNNNVTLTDWNEKYIQLSVGNESILKDSFDLELNVTDENTKSPVVGATYNVTVTTSNNTTYTYGNNVTDENGQIKLELPGTGEVHIAIVEQIPAVGYQKSNMAKEFTIHRQDGEVKYAYGLNSSANNYFTVNCQNVDDKVIVNTTSILKSERNTVKIKASDSIEIPQQGLENVEFSLVNNTTGKTYGPLHTNVDGEVEFTVDEEKQGTYEYSLIANEVPYGYLPLTEPIRFNIHFDEKGYIDSVSDIDSVEKIEYQLTEDENLKSHTAYMELGIEMDNNLAYYFQIALTDIDTNEAIEGATYNIEIKSGDYVKKITKRPTDAKGLINTRIAVDTSKVKELEITVEQLTTKIGYKADVPAQEIVVNLLNNQFTHTPEEVKPGDNKEGQIRYTDIDEKTITYHHTNRKKDSSDIVLNINLTTIEKTSESVVGGKNVKITNKAVENEDNKLLKQITLSDGSELNVENITSTEVPKVGYLSFEDLKVIGANIPGEQEYEIEIEVDKNLIRCRLTFKYNEYTQMVELVNVETVWGNRLIRSKNFSSYENENGYVSDVNLEVYTDYDATGNLSLDLKKADLETKNALAAAKYDIIIERPDGTKVVRSNLEVFENKIELDGVYVPIGTVIYITEATAPIGYDLNDTVILKVKEIDEYTNEVILEKEEESYKTPRSELNQEQSINTANGMVQSQYTLNLFDVQSDKFKFKINAIDSKENKGVEGYQFEISNDTGVQRITKDTNENGEVTTLIGGIYDEISSPKTYTIKSVKVGTYYKKLVNPIEAKVYFRADGSIDTNKTLNGQTDENYAPNGTEFGKWRIEETNKIDEEGNIVYDLSIVINVETIDPLQVEIETVNKFTNEVITGANYEITPSVKKAIGSTNIEVSYAEAGVARTYKINQTVPDNYVPLTNLEFALSFDDNGNIDTNPSINSSNMKLVSYEGKNIKLQIAVEPKVGIAITNLYYFNQEEVLQGGEFSATDITKDIATGVDGKAAGTIGAYGEPNTDVTYTVTQTKAKYGYAVVDPFDITVHYGENREITNVTLVQPDNRFVQVGYIEPSSNEDYGYNQTDKGIITLTVLNYKAVTMNITNRDRQNPEKLLPGTEYKVTSDIPTEGTGLTNEEGLAVTYVGKSGFNRTVHYEIEEVKPSFGHQSFGTKIKLDVDFNEEGFITRCAITNDPNIGNIATAQTVTPIVTIEDNLTINIELKNNPLMKFNITKVDLQNKDTVIKDVTLEVTGVLDETEYTKDSVITNQNGQATANVDRTLENKTMVYTIKETKKSPFYEWLKEEIKLEVSYNETGKMQQENGYRIIAGNAYIDVTNVDPDNFSLDMTIYNEAIKAFGIHLYTDDIYDNTKKVQKATWNAWLTDTKSTGHVKDEEYNTTLISGRDDNNDENPDLAYGEDYQIVGEYTRGAGQRTLRLTTNNNGLPNQYLANNKLYSSVYNLDSYEILVDIEFDDEGKLVGEPKLRTGKDYYVGWLLDERYVEVSKQGDYGVNVIVHYYPKLQVQILNQDMYTNDSINATMQVSTVESLGDRKVVRSGYIGDGTYVSLERILGRHSTVTATSRNYIALSNIENNDAPETVQVEEGGSTITLYRRYIYLYEINEPTDLIQYQKYRPRQIIDYYDRQIVKVPVYYTQNGEIYNGKMENAIIGELYSSNNIKDPQIANVTVTPDIERNAHSIKVNLDYAPITTAKLTIKDEVSGQGIGGIEISPYGGNTSQTNTSYEYRTDLTYHTNNNGEASWTYWGANVANDKNIYKIHISDIKQGYFGYSESTFRDIEVEVSYSETGRISHARVLNKDGLDHVAAEIDESCYGTTELKLVLKLKRKMGMQINKVDKYDNNIELSAKFAISNNIDSSGVNSTYTINTGSKKEQLSGRIIADNTVEYTLSEVTVPDGYKPLDQNLKLIVKYRSNGTIESAYAGDDYSKEHLRVDYICQTPRGDNSLLYKDIEITIVNEPKFAVELELTDKFYSNIKIDNVTFNMTNSEGDVAVGNLVTNSSGKIYTYIGAVHPGKTVTYTITQANKANGYYKLEQPITFSVTFDESGKPVDIPVLASSYEQEYASILTTDVTRFRTDYTTRIKVYNMPEKVYLGINKYDQLTSLPLQDVEFKVTVEENGTKRDINSIVTNGQGHAIVQIDTFKEEASGRSVIYTINEVQALDSYRKIQDFKVQVLYDAKGGISSWQVLSNESNLSYSIFKRGNTQISKMEDTYTHMVLNVPNDNTYDVIIKDEDSNYPGLGVEGTKYDVSINGTEKDVDTTSVDGITKLTNLTENGNIQIRIAERTIGEGYRENKENDITLQILKAATGAYSLSLDTLNMTDYEISETANSTDKLPEYRIDLTDNTYVIVGVSEEYGEIYVTFHNETKAELTLIKQDINTKVSLSEVEFKITKNNISTGEETVLTESQKTDANGRIYFDLGIAPQNATVVYTFTELTQPEPNDTYQTILLPQTVTVTYDMYGRVSNITTNSKLRTKAFLDNDNINCRNIITTIGNGTIDPKYTVKIVTEDVDTGRRINGSTFDVEIKTADGKTLTQLPISKDAKDLPNITQNLCTDGKFHTDSEVQNDRLKVIEKGIIQTEAINYKGDIVINISQTGFAYGYIPGLQKVTGQVKLKTDFTDNANGSIDSTLSMELQDNDGLEVTVDEQSREIIVTIKNESRMQLTIQKMSSVVNEDGSRNLISGANFNVTSQIITASNAQDTDLNIVTRQTGADGITSEAVGKVYAGKTVVYTIHENEIEGYKSIEDVQIAVVYDLKGNISYVELLSAYTDILNWSDIADSFIGTRDIKLSILNTPIVNDYQIVLNKHDIDDELYPDLIPGAEYEITVEEQFGETKTWTTITNSAGKIISNYFSGYGTINITLKEISAPVGYELDPAPKYITVFRDKNSGIIQKYSSDVNIDISEDNSTIILKPVDKETNNTYSILIDKIDIDTGKKITEDSAEFEVTITKQEELKEDTNEEQNVPNDVEGETDLEESKVALQALEEAVKQVQTTIVTYQETLSKMITVDGRAMLRSIDIPEKEGTYIYTIKETKVPTGYNEDPEEIKFEVVFEKNEKGIMLIKSAKQISGEYASIFAIKEQAIGFTIGNKNKNFIPADDEYEFNIYKVNEEGTIITDKAIFKITMPDGTSKYVETDENGKLDLAYMKLPSEGASQTITVQEIMAPNGYELEKDPITVEITFEEIEGHIQIKEVNLQGENANIVERQEKRIDMNIINKTKKKEDPDVPPVKQDNYTLVINKLDNKTNTPITPAKFLLTLEDGQKLELTTDENGKITIDTMKVPIEAGTYPYVIKELEAPEGYILDQEYKVLEVTFAKNGEEMQIVSAEMVSGKNTSATILENGDVSVNVLNEKTGEQPIDPVTEEFEFNFYKVDKDNQPILDMAIFKVTYPDGTYDYVGTNENGKLELEKMKFPTEEGVKTYTIEEIMAPNGYKLEKTPITLNLTFGKVDGNMQIKEIHYEGNNLNITVAEGKRIDMNIINQKEEQPKPVDPPEESEKYTLVINKLDSKEKQPITHAKFLLTLSDGQKLELTTDENGKITVDNMVVPEEEGTYPYVMKELKAPEGYKLDSEYKILEVTFEKVNGKMEIVSAEIVSGKNATVSILEDSRVSVDILNEKEDKNNPDDPNKPDNPDDPNKPDNPDDPNKPDNPDDPNKPDNPDDPNKPDNPDDPNKPDNPDDPNKPDNPSTSKGFDVKTEKYLEKYTQTYRDTNEVISQNVTRKNGVTKLDVKKDRIKYLQLELTYKIIVTNIGDKEGRITSIIDRIPSYVYMDPSMNKDWILNGNIATYPLNNKVLKPGESVEVTITLHYDGRSGQVGTITNYAAFESPDEKDMGNEANSNNISNATFILSVRTGQEWIIYTTLTITALGILAIGIFGIKKYVLNT